MCRTFNAKKEICYNYLSLNVTSLFLYWCMLWTAIQRKKTSLARNNGHFKSFKLKRKILPIKPAFIIWIRWLRRPYTMNWRAACGDPKSLISVGNWASLNGVVLTLEVLRVVIENLCVLTSCSLVEVASSSRMIEAVRYVTSCHSVTFHKTTNLEA